MSSKPRMRAHHIGAALLLPALLAVGCSGGGSDGPEADAGSSTTSATASPTRGGSVRFVVPQELATLDPAVALTTTGGDRYFAIYGALVVTAYPSSEVVPVLATSVESADGGTTWTIELRSDVKFSDGTPFDADAVTFNWDRIKDPAVRSTQVSQLAQMASYRAVDATTVEVVLKTVNTQFPLALANGLSYIGSPTALRAEGADFGAHPIGAGPYVLDRWVRDSEMVLRRNPTYWDAPRPYLDEVVLKPITDESQAAATFESGGADLVYSILDQTGTRLASSGTVTRLPQLGGPGIGMDVTSPPFDDRSIRRAVAMAIDPRGVIAAGYPGGIAATSLLPKNSPLYSKALDYPSPDLAKAQSLVDAYRAKHGGKDVGVTYDYVEIPAQRLAAESIQGQLNRLKGFHVTLRGLAPAQFVSGLNAKAMPFAQSQIPGVWVEPTLFETFHTGAQRNQFHYSNPVVDAALEKARVDLDRADQLKDYIRAAEQIAHDLPFFGYRSSVYYFGANPQVHGIDKALVYAGSLRLDRLWRTRG